MDLKDPKNKNQLCINISTFSTKQQNYLTRQVNEDYHRAAVLYYGLHSQFVKVNVLPPIEAGDFLQNQVKKRKNISRQ